MVISSSGASGKLTTKEAQLLAYLASRPSTIIPRDELLREVWGYADHVLSRAADHTVTRLRKKIEPDPSNPIHLLTIHGTGYRFEPQVSVTPESRPRRQARPVLTLKSCVVDLGRRTVSRGAERDKLTNTEAELLTFLVDHPGITSSRDELLRKVWGRAWTTGDRTVDVAVRRLRARIEADPAAPDHLVTVRGEGYRLEAITKPVAPPSGEVALVCSSLTDAGRLWDAEPDAMARAVDLAADLLAGLAQQRNGYLTSRSGHRLQLAFQEVDDALQWSVTAQLALLEVPWPAALLDRPEAAEIHGPTGRLLARGPRVAMAIHSGKPHMREDSRTGRTHYLGPVAIHASAILERAAGGQTLMSRGTFTTLTTSSRDLVRSTELGEVGLSGPAEHRQLVSLLPREIAGRTFASTRARAKLLATLPVDASSFVGREAELTRLAERIAANRLVTLHGAPGVGKSRVALRFALERPDQFAGGVWWCSTEDAHTQADLTSAVGSVLGLGAIPRSAVEQIGAALAGRGEALVVLDGFDHLVQEGLNPLQQWLAAAPEIAFLVTSRRVLGDANEAVVEIGPLGVTEGVRLFRERAPTQTATDADVLAALVGRLDGLPLAIEFAAARSTVLPPALLLERISDSLHYLGNTLQSAVLSSWEGLTVEEQRGLQALSVFPAGFSLAAAEAVLSADSGIDAVDLLQGLRDKSLLRSWTPFERPDSVRFRVYESIRQHANSLEHPNATANRRLFVTFFAAYGSADYQQSLYRDGGLNRTADMALERANIRTAAEWALADGDVISAASASLAHLQILLLKAGFDDGIPLARLVLGRPELPPLPRARLSRVLGACLRTVGKPTESWAALQTALALDDRPKGVVDSLCQLGTVARHLPEVDAGPLFERALQVATDNELMGQIGVALDCLAVFANRQGRVEDAKDGLQRALSLHLEVGDVRRAAFTHYRLGMIAAAAGQLDVAAGHFGEALDAALTMGDHRFEVMIRNALAISLQLQGRLEHARTQVEAALLCFAGQGDAGEATSHCLLVCIALQLDDREEADRRFDLAAELTAGIHLDMHREACVCNLAECRLLMGQLDQASKWAHEALSLTDPGDIGRGFALRILADVALQSDDLDTSQVLATESETILRSVDDIGEVAAILCLKSRLVVARNEWEAARQVREELGGIAQTMGCLPASQVSRHLVQLDGVILRQFGPTGN